jgi:hypothetical protein
MYIFDFEEKKKKRRKKKNGEKFNKQHYFLPYLRRGHQFDHVSRGVPVQEEELKIQ